MGRRGTGRLAGRVLLAAAACGAGAVPFRAAAQYIPGQFPTGVPGYGQELGVTVVSRLHPLYDQPGIRLGGFILRPELTKSTGYNSNIGGIGGGGGSPGIETHPSLSVNSDWGRDAVGANVAVDDYRYPSLPSQNQTNWSVALGGDQEFGRSHLTLGYAHLALHESPTDIGAPLSTTPIPYTVDDARMAYRLTRGRLEITPNFDASLSRYGTAEINGAVANQDFRNVNAFSAGVALRYALSDQGAAIFTMQGIRSDFIVQQPGAASPNATSVLALGGIDYQYDGVWRYQLLVGAEVRSFELGAVPDPGRPDRARRGDLDADRTHHRHRQPAAHAREPDPARIQRVRLYRGDGTGGSRVPAQRRAERGGGGATRGLSGARHDPDRVQHRDRSDLAHQPPSAADGRIYVLGADERFKSGGRRVGQFGLHAEPVSDQPASGRVRVRSGLAPGPAPGLSMISSA